MRRVESSWEMKSFPVMVKTCTHIIFYETHKGILNASIEITRNVISEIFFHALQSNSIIYQLPFYILHKLRDCSFLLNLMREKKIIKNVF